VQQSPAQDERARIRRYDGNGACQNSSCRCPKSTQSNSCFLQCCYGLLFGISRAMDKELNAKVLSSFAVDFREGAVAA
jgi:hypothetical protein